MPQEARSPKEIEAIKNQALDAAMDILAEKGFERMTMSAIATRMRMTAANLYNYFANKDEIYLIMQTRGFSMMAQAFSKVEKQRIDAVKKMENLIRAYFEFARENPDLYAIMFSFNTPKFADYEGTPIESKAAQEKQAALEVAQITARIIAKAAKNRSSASRLDPFYETLKAWTTLHGAVSLIYSRVLQEVDPDVEAYIDKITQDLLKPFAVKSRIKPVKAAKKPARKKVSRSQDRKPVFLTQAEKNSVTG